MPGFIHRLFGRDRGECEHLHSGKTLWEKGSSDGWYYHSKVGIGEQLKDTSQASFRHLA